MVRAPTISRLPFAPLVALVRLVVQNGGVHPRRIPLLVAAIFRLVLFEPLRLAERFLTDRKVDAYQLERDPIFIIGHWRSGTSWLQTLLSQGPELTTSTLYRCLFADIFLITESWLKRPMNAVVKLLRLPFSIQRLPFDFDIPAEGEVALASLLSPCSSAWAHVFPQRFGELMNRCVLQPEPAVAEAWLSDYDRLIRKLSLAAGRKQVVMKSPGDTARTDLLLRRYPNARFIYIHRDPFDVFCSNRYLWQVIRREVSLHRLSDDQVDERILSMYRSLLERYLEQRSKIPAGQLTEVRFENLQAEPLAELRRVYSELGLGSPPPEIASFLADQVPYAATTYERSPDIERKLRQAWAFAYDEWCRTDAGGQHG